MKIITTHKNTDFDALASVIAATLIYPDAKPVLPKQINPNVKAFLSIHKDLFEPYGFEDIKLETVQTLIIVDANSWSRLGRLRKLKSRSNLEIILWDHHAIRGDIGPNWACQEEIGANITLLLREIKKQRKIITPIQATLFLTGLYEDTGNLTFTSTQPEDAAAAAYLLERKADLGLVGTFLRPAYGEKQKDVLFEMLKNAKRSKINGPPREHQSNAHFRTRGPPGCGGAHVPGDTERGCGFWHFSPPGKKHLHGDRAQRE